MPFRVDGLADLIHDFEDFSEMPDEVLSEMLDAEAEVVIAAQKRTAGAMLQGPYNRGGVAGAVRKGKTWKTSDGRVRQIDFEGSQHGNRLAEIAFINEFGKTNQPARPFIATANEDSAEEAVQKGAAVYDRYLSGKGL